MCIQPHDTFSNKVKINGYDSHFNACMHIPQMYVIIIDTNKNFFYLSYGVSLSFRRLYLSYKLYYGWLQRQFCRKGCHTGHSLLEPISLSVKFTSHVVSSRPQHKFVTCIEMSLRLHRVFDCMNCIFDWLCLFENI